MNRKLSLVGIVMGLALCASSAFALGPVDLGVEVDYASSYIWRGFNVYGDGDAAQPSGYIGYAPSEALSMTAAVWASYDVEMEKDWDEIDYTADLAYTINDTWSVAGGYIYYHWFSDSDADTQEIWASASAGLPHGLSSTLAVYYDFDEGDGWYANISLDYGRDFADNVSFSTGANLGYGDYDDDGYMAGFDGVQDINLYAGFDVDLGYNLGLTASATYTIVPDDDINEDDEFWTLVGLLYDF